MAQTPVDDFQQSLTLTQYFPLGGVFPSQGGSTTGFFLGKIGIFAGNFDPAGDLAAGQLLPISQNTAVFSILGTTYGGNGQTNFALPNLQGAAMLGEGQGAGLNPETEGVPVGASSVTLTVPQTPPDIGGTSQPFDNYQPSLPVRYEISLFGVFPTQGGSGGGNLSMIGRVMPFAGNFNPGGFAECAGQLLQISQFTALFSILGTTYGGDGVHTFALPDLRGRDIIGASATDPIGTKVGQPTVSLADNQTPNGSNNPVQPFDNRQPSLALNYLIATQGIFPSQGGGSQNFTTPLLGQIVAFAGNFAPDGWAFANGALLSISQNTALFSILGTTYGGNGITTFALPDLRDRAVIGSGNGFTVGDLVGANFPTITADQLPNIKFWAGSVSTDWFDAGNWNPSGIPAATDNVIIGMTGTSPTINATSTVNTLRINGTDTLTFGDANSANSAGLTATSGVTISGGGTITGQGSITGNVTATGPATIGVSRVSGNAQPTPQMEFFGTITDIGGQLTLLIADTTDDLILTKSSTAHAVSFNGANGRLTLQDTGAGIALTVGSQMAIGSGSVFLASATPGGAVLTDASGVTISTGTILGQGILNAAVSATDAATIATAFGTLEVTGNIIDSGGQLTLSIANDSDKLLLDGASATNLVVFSTNNILELNSGAALTVGTPMVIGGNTLKLDGLDAALTDANGVAILTDANGATLNGGSIQGFGKVNAGLTGTGTIMASGGTLELQTAIGKSSGPVFQVANAASNILQLDGTVGTGNSFAFLGANGDLGLGNDAGFTNVVSGLNVGAAGAKTNFVDIEGHTVTIQTVTGQGTTSGVITLSDGAVLQLTGLNSTAWFANTVSDNAGGTEIFVSDVCFCRGTLILTDEGEAAVEALAVGDRVRTLSGECKPIVWIGFGRDLVTRANRLARPIVVRRGALADDVPRRDLYLTHGHALHLEGVLIPVEHLVYHRSIVWDDAARVVEYYHIELADHDVVFAEGAPAESYYDASNRAQFLNTREGSEAGAKKPTCAPVLNGGDVVENAWARLSERAGGQIECDTTDDPDLHLVVNGERLDPVSREDCVYTFALARPPAGTLLVRSRSAVPSLIGLNRHEHRRLGVAVRQIIVHRPGVMTSFDPDGPVFTEGGCHPAESGYSWTDGELHLPAPLFAHLKGALTLIIHTQKRGMRYPVAAALAKAA